MLGQLSGWRRHRNKGPAVTAPADGGLVVVLMVAVVLLLLLDGEDLLLDAVNNRIKSI